MIHGPKGREGEARRAPLGSPGIDPRAGWGPVLRPALWITVGLALVLVCPIQAQPITSPAPQVTDDEVVERLLELQEEIERLLPFLPPEVRRDIAQRLAERATAQERQAEQAVQDEAAAAQAASTEPPSGPEALESASSPPSPPSMPSTPSTQPRETPEVPEPRTVRAECNTLDLLDSQKDGYIDAGDRYWRYLYLWTDANGNGEVEPREVRSAFDAGVRRISVLLDRFEGKDDTVGLIRIGRWIVLDPEGDGFSGGITGATDDGALTVDAGSMGRFSGPKLLGPDGLPLEGMQPFRAGLRMRGEDGRVLALTCPR